jgi:hypothetical protein
LSSIAAAWKRLPWWVEPVSVVIVLSVFGLYSFLIVTFLPGEYKDYLSPFYSPPIPHPDWVPDFITAPMFIIWMPLGFVLNNVHRYFLYASFVVLAFLWYDTVLTFFPGGSFGVKVGSIIWLVNVILLSTYSLSCHSLRHLVGGNKNCYTCVMGGNTRRKLYNGISRLNLQHPQWAWFSLFSVLLTDVYFRLIQAGVIPDLTILG